MGLIPSPYILIEFAFVCLSVCSELWSNTPPERQKLLSCGFLQKLDTPFVSSLLEQNSKYERRERRELNRRERR